MRKEWQHCTSIYASLQRQKSETFVWRNPLVFTCFPHE